MTLTRGQTRLKGFTEREGARERKKRTHESPHLRKAGDHKKRILKPVRRFNYGSLSPLHPSHKTPCMKRKNQLQNGKPVSVETSKRCREEKEKSKWEGGTHVPLILFSHMQANELQGTQGGERRE